MLYPTYMDNKPANNQSEGPIVVPLKERHKQDSFADEFLKDLNASAAVIRCGFDTVHPGQLGYYLMQLPEIQQKIQAAMTARAERTTITKDRVLQEMARVAFANQTDFATWDDGKVCLKNSTALSRDDTACVSEVSQTTHPNGTRKVSIRLHDKMKALEMLGRHLVLFNDKLDLNANVQVGGVLRVPTQSAEDWEKEHGEG